MGFCSHPFTPLRPQRVAGVATGHRIVNAARLQHPQYIGSMLGNIVDQIDDFMTEGDIKMVVPAVQPRIGLINHRQMPFQPVGFIDGPASDINAKPLLKWAELVQQAQKTALIAAEIQHLHAGQFVFRHQADKMAPDGRMAIGHSLFRARIAIPGGNGRG